ncbi:MAG TPA: NYN domain-containing protein [Haloplasmataceae bacterium]
MRQSLFLDVDGIENALMIHQAEIDYASLRLYFTQEKEELNAYAFMTLDVTKPHAKDALIKRLWDDGYIVKTYPTDPYVPSYPSNLPLEMAITILTQAYTQNLQRIILVTNRSEFTNLILQLREWGIAVVLVTLMDNPPISFITKANRVLSLYHYLVEQEKIDPIMDRKRRCDEGLQDKEKSQLKHTNRPIIPTIKQVKRINDKYDNIPHIELASTTRDSK